VNAVAIEPTSRATTAVRATARTET